MQSAVFGVFISVIYMSSITIINIYYGQLCVMNEVSRDKCCVSWRTKIKYGLIV